MDSHFECVSLLHILETQFNWSPQWVNMVVYHLQQLSGNFGWKVNGTRLFGSFQWKISRSKETSKKVVLFFRTECSKQKLVYHLFKPNLCYQFQALAAIFCPNNNYLGKENVTFKRTSQSETSWRLF